MAKTVRRRSHRTNYGRAFRGQLVQQKAGDPLPWSAQIADDVADILGPSETSRIEAQVTESENHPSWKRTREGRFQGDIGGEFTMTRTWVEKSTPNVFMAGPIPNSNPRRVVWRYGPILAGNPSSVQHFPPDFASNNLALDAWGAKAIAQCKPTNSVVDLATALGETVREGIPKLIGMALWKDRTKDALKASASEFLNVEFGFLPMANEMAKTAYAVTECDRIIRQYRRDAGKQVRRRFEFPPVTTTATDVVADPADLYVHLGHSALLRPGSGYGRRIRTRKTVIRRWFSGAFTYYLPESDTFWGDMSAGVLEAKKLLGVTPTPDVIWNLTPWSWATDWFLNTGDVISNLTSWAVDGLCLRYGYMMEHTLTRDTHVYVPGEEGTSLRYSSYIPAPMTFCRETKLRRKANPFGFGLTWNGLSPVQLAIAAALGITRS